VMTTVPRWEWSGSCDPFLHFRDQAISLEQMKLDVSNLVCRLNVKSTAITHVKVLQCGGLQSGSCDILKFLDIIAHISEMVPDRDVVTMED